MVSCTADPPEMFLNGEFLDAINCWLTGGGDLALVVIIPTLIYGAVLMGYFIVGQSPVMPLIMSFILAGVIFTSFPASALTILVTAVLFAIGLVGTVLTWRMGR